MNRDFVHEGRCVASGRRPFDFERALELKRKQRGRAAIYRCDFCGCWHLRLVTSEEKLR